MVVRSSYQHSFMIDVVVTVARDVCMSVKEMSAGWICEFGLMAKRDSVGRAEHQSAFVEAE